MIARQHVGAIAEQNVDLQQQVVEVHRAILLAATAVDIVDLGKLGLLALAILGGKRGVGSVCRRCDQLILSQRDTRADLLRFVVVVAQIQLLENGLDEVAAVRRLVDCEGLREANALGLVVQNAREDRVERTHTDIATLAALDHLFDTFAHLGSGLIGKREGEDRMGSHALFDHISDAGGEHARFARAGTRYDERGRGVVDHSRPLSRVQSCEYLRFHNSTKIRIKKFTFGISRTTIINKDSAAGDPRADGTGDLSERVGVWI